MLAAPPPAPCLVPPPPATRGLVSWPEPLEAARNRDRALLMRDFWWAVLSMDLLVSDVFVWRPVVHNCARDLADEAGEASNFLLGAGAWTEEFASDVAAMGEAADDRDMASVADAMHHGAA